MIAEEMGALLTVAMSLMDKVTKKSSATIWDKVKTIF